MVDPLVLRLAIQSHHIRKAVEELCPNPADALMALFMCACDVTYGTRKDEASIDDADLMMRKVFSTLAELARARAEKDQK